jgi:hypothetical protein
LDIQADKKDDISSQLIGLIQGDVMKGSYPPQSNNILDLRVANRFYSDPQGGCNEHSTGMEKKL